MGTSKDMSTKTTKRSTSSKKVTTNRLKNRSLPRNISKSGSTYRVRKMIDGIEKGATFERLKDAKAYKTMMGW